MTFYLDMVGVYQEKWAWKARKQISIAQPYYSGPAIYFPRRPGDHSIKTFLSKGCCDLLLKIKKTLGVTSVFPLAELLQDIPRFPSPWSAFKECEEERGLWRREHNLKKKKKNIGKFQSCNQLCYWQSLVINTSRLQPKNKYCKITPCSECCNQSVNFTNWLNALLETDQWRIHSKHTRSHWSSHHSFYLNIMTHYDHYGPQNGI